MIPTQHPKIYISGIEDHRAVLGRVNASVRDAYVRFWTDPIGQLTALTDQARVCGMTPLEVFTGHQAAIQYLSVVAPDLLAPWFAGVPIEVPFVEGGGVDAAELATRWAAYQATLPQPEPEVPADEP